MSEGIFPDCDCHYTIDDDGIHFCELHKNAEKTISSLKARLSAAERVIEAASNVTILTNTDFNKLWASKFDKAIDEYDQLTQHKEEAP